VSWVLLDDIHLKILKHWMVNQQRSAWKSSLCHGGHPLSDYNLFVVLLGLLSVHVATQAEGTMIIDVVLAFIKAYCQQLR